MSAAGGRGAGQAGAAALVPEPPSDDPLLAGLAVLDEVDDELSEPDDDEPASDELPLSAAGVAVSALDLGDAALEEPRLSVL